MVDQVERLAKAIARLQPQEKQRLLELLTQEAGATRKPPAAADSQPRPRPNRSRRNWSPDYLLVFDGGSRGNPGRGYGSYALIRVQDGAQRLERREFGDGYTNNEAEYDILIAGLQDLISRIEEAGRQPEEFQLEVRGDSALVINQVQGRWKATEPRMIERRDRCRPLLGRFGAVRLKAHPREESVRVLGH
jgi:ribonuclease HI